MSRVCLLSLAALLACARAYEDMPAASQALEPEVVASEGGTATLRCLFHGNPKPNKITWRFRAHTIDGNADRYKLISDGALEINPLYRSDTGVYTCLADNGLGVALREVHLIVNDESAPHQVIPQKELVASEGGTATLRYLFPGNPPLKITRKFRQLGEHQQRTRHKRQGTGLYLPASYVIPGGEGEGQWGEWGEVSSCSRTCGGGVASQKRICLHSGPEGPQCTGGDTKYFSCQTQDCPEGSGDFRAEQCAEFNEKAFRGFKYNWAPYMKASNPCELNCRPHGEQFYFQHKPQVTDGTRCNYESFDVCVNGKCQPVGCDLMLNSTAREDKCRECRGNGANCRTTNGILDSQDLMRGYNDILLLPAGSTSIHIEEMEPSYNYLALRTKNGTYYLNGHYHIDVPRTIMIAGALWTYERIQQGFAAPDKLRSLGPTTEPLYLSLLLQDVNVGIRYEYSVPNNLAPPTDKQYNWVYEEFTPCSATCGGGFQTRNVTCRSREELEMVDASLCDEGLRLPTNQSCSPNPCPAYWVQGPWGECSQRCGSGGVKSREVTCQKIIAYGIKSVVPDKECFDLLGPKSEVFQKCNEDAPCPTWFVGHWRPCNKLCGEGKQTRQVACYQKKNDCIKLLDNENCTEVKPEEEQPCMLQPCDGVDWVTSSWSGCDSCTSKFRTRAVVCATKSRQMLNESFCSHFNRPADHEECHKDVLPSCEVQWYATQWSKCLVNCGDGVQTRKVFCGIYYNDESGKGVEEVEDAKCANLTKDSDTRPCTVPKEECPSQWFGGPWSACSEGCREGEQYRRVMCFRGDKQATDCDRTTVLESVRFCNTGSCHSDSVRMPAGIAGDENATMIGELGSPLHVRCLAYGYPPPCVFWYRSSEEVMALYNDAEHEVRGNDLIFRSLSIDSLGQYSCRAYNGVGKVVSWGLVVRAYKPEGLFIDSEWLVPRSTVAPTTTTTTEAHRLLFTETSTAGGLTEATEETTELFETSERSSTNEDTIDVISTTTLGPCSGFEFGCCADNETEASGPDGQGCPCNATEFGSCPDGVSPETSTAGGLTETTEDITELFETSERSSTNEDTIDVIGTTTLGPCSGFEFGCCADNETEASGPDGQGCPCNANEFGSCSDGLVDAVRVPAGIAGDENATVTGELGSPLHVRCLAYGHPHPCVFWYRNYEEVMALYNDAEREVRGNDLIFRSLSIDSLGQYSCRAYNGVGKVASWGLVVRAYKPAGLFIDNEWLVPRDAVAPTTTTTTEAHRPFTDVPEEAPQALPQQEPEVSASEGGTATLRCLFHGNPPSTITWRFGELTIDGNSDRYRLMSDGALEIVSLYRNDTGVYTCVADNGLGVASQEVHLAVNDPVRIPVGIAGDENAVMIGELGRPFHVRCLAYGYPPPSVFWYRGYGSVMVPYNDAVYEARGNGLLIRSLALETLGQYTCQAYNGEGKVASWVIFVQAYTPEGLFIDNETLVPRNTVVTRLKTQPPTTAETMTTAEKTTTTTSTTTEAPIPMFTVPVSTHLSWSFLTLNIGSNLHLACEVDGFPEPDMHWTKDGSTIQTDDRITITGSMFASRLTVLRVSVADSGLYACHASNPYSSQSDTAQINVQQLVVPAKCTDNPFFANCDLIVRSKFCRHKYYSKFCCKSCVEAGQLDPQEAELQADQPLRKK